jgi:hypothetical protein
MQNMLDNPAFLQQMAATMQNPQMIDQIIAMNPDLAAMGPQVREMFQSDRFREMMCVCFTSIIPRRFCPCFLISFMFRWSRAWACLLFAWSGLRSLIKRLTDFGLSQVES